MATPISEDLPTSQLPPLPQNLESSSCPRRIWDCFIRAISFLIRSLGNLFCCCRTTKSVDPQPRSFSKIDPQTPPPQPILEEPPPKQHPSIPGTPPTSAPSLESIQTEPLSSLSNPLIQQAPEEPPPKQHPSAPGIQIKSPTVEAPPTSLPSLESIQPGPLPSSSKVLANPSRSVAQDQYFDILFLTDGDSEVKKEAVQKTILAYLQRAYPSKKFRGTLYNYALFNQEDVEKLPPAKKKFSNYFFTFVLRCHTERMTWSELEEVTDKINFKMSDKTKCTGIIYLDWIADNTPYTEPQLTWDEQIEGVFHWIGNEKGPHAKSTWQQAREKEVFEYIKKQRISFLTEK